MKKRVLTLILAALLVIGCVPAAASEAPAVSPFSDVSPDDWFYSYVMELYQQDIIRGTENGSYLPYETVSWGQAFKLILGAIGVKADESKNSGHWADVYVQPAINNRLVYSFNKSYLDEPVDRLSIARMTARAMDLVSISGPSPYVDCDDGYVVELYEKGIMIGQNDGTHFMPNEPITRSEMATLIWRIMHSDYQGDMVRVSNYWVDLFDSVPRSTFSRAQFSTDSAGRVTYNNGWYVRGVDVSEHKGVIDWYSVKEDGIDFAIIRVGGRYLNSGNIFADKYWRRNVEGALAAGLNVGVYFFSQALNAKEGLEEAEYVLDLIKDYKDQIDYPVICDWEYLGNYSSTDHARTYLCEPGPVTDGIAAFCERVEQEGYTAGVYFNKYCGMVKMDLSRLTDYEFWYDEYTKYPTSPYQFQMWQYSCTGKVAGISSNTDMDLCFVPYAPVKPAAPRPGQEPEPEPDPEPEPTPDPCPEETAPPEIDPELSTPGEESAPPEEILWRKL